MLEKVFFRTNKELEKLILNDARFNFIGNYSETLRGRLSEIYKIKINPSNSAGNYKINCKTNTRIFKIEKEVYGLMNNEAMEKYEGNVSLLIRKKLKEYYSK